MPGLPEAQLIRIKRRPRYASQCRPAGCYQAPRYDGGLQFRGTPDVDCSRTGGPVLTARGAAGAVFALFSAAMLGLAAGAVWMLPTMQLQRPLAWLALPIGWLLGLAVRAWIRPAGALAALAAALATLLAAAYVTFLTAAARVAGLMGMGLLQAMRESGGGMLLQLARLSLSPVQLVWFVTGAALAAWCAWPRPRQPG